VGLPGEVVMIDRGVVKIVNNEYPKGFTLPEPYISEGNKTLETFRYTVPEDELFVMGDNRRASSDSRIWGPLPIELVVGRAFLRVLPLTETDVLPGAYTAPF